MNQYHQSVLLKEVTEFLNVRPGCLYIDATIGGGGHTRQILKRGGKVLGIDCDPDAIEHIKKSQKSEIKSQKLVLVYGNFSNIGDIAKGKGFDQVDGVLFDLGVSSHQLETPIRGFSFAKDGPLDMRMDTRTNVTAADLVNNFNQRRLNEIFKTYADEKFSWPISGAICRARQIRPIKTTGQLAEIVTEVYQKYLKKHSHSLQAKLGMVKIHPATKVFQALRIIVNSELLNLTESLPQTFKKKGPIGCC